LPDRPRYSMKSEHTEVSEPVVMTTKTVTFSFALLRAFASRVNEVDRGGHHGFLQGGSAQFQWPEAQSSRPRLLLNRPPSRDPSLRSAIPFGLRQKALAVGSGRQQGLRWIRTSSAYSEILDYRKSSGRNKGTSQRDPAREIWACGHARRPEQSVDQQSGGTILKELLLSASRFSILRI